MEVTLIQTTTNIKISNYNFEQNMNRKYILKLTDSTLNAERLHAFPIIRNKMRVPALTTVIQYGDGSKALANYNHRRASRGFHLCTLSKDTEGHL